MNDAQIGTIIGVLAAAFVGFMTLIVGRVNRTIAAELKSIRVEIGALRTEFDLRMDGLDRDVAAIAKKVFGDQ